MWIVRLHDVLHDVLHEEPHDTSPAYSYAGGTPYEPSILRASLLGKWTSRTRKETRGTRGVAASAPRCGRTDAEGVAGRCTLRAMAFDPQQDALWTAVGNRDHDECRRLVARGADVNMVCPDGWVRDECRPKDGAVGRSLLHHAAWAGDEAIFRFLVGAGADPTRRRNTAWRPNGGARGRGSTPLHHAVQYNRAAIVTYLLDEVTPGIICVVDRLESVAL